MLTTVSGTVGGQLRQVSLYIHTYMHAYVCTYIHGKMADEVSDQFENYLNLTVIATEQSGNMKKG